MIDVNYRSAVRRGAMAAERLHRQLESRKAIRAKGGNIDVFNAILQLEVPLLLRPLEGLLGAFLCSPTPGLLVTTQRPLSVQRFTAAHELGHLRLNHEPSLDDENILRRSPFGSRPDYGLQEVEADSFAVSFLMPRWLIAWHAKRQGWQADSFADPHIVYQLSLRLGASFEATWRTLQHYKIVTSQTGRSLGKVRVRDLKKALLVDYQPLDYRRDVWLLTEHDSGTSISGSAEDLIVLRLEEHSGGGYLWNVEDLTRSGFSVVGDVREEVDSVGIGNSTFRRLTAIVEEPHKGRVFLGECRPWQPGRLLKSLELYCDLTGPEDEGYSRVERRRILEAA